MAVDGAVHLSGEDLADLLRPLSELSATAGSIAHGPISVTAAVRDARAIESRHEVVALLPHRAGTGRWQLLLNYHNWNAFRKDSEAEDPTMVVSFLGDTEVGKSHTIRELMDPSEERPFVQRGSEQNQSTTTGVNLYPCRSLVGSNVAVMMLDYEGEHGSELPVFADGRKTIASSAGSLIGSGGRVNGSQGGGMLQTIGASLGLASGASASASAPGPGRPPASSAVSGSGLGMRAEAVKEFFPRLAYTTSDVVVMVGTEPFFSTRWV